MATETTKLPEGTDTIIAGASKTTTTTTATPYAESTQVDVIQAEPTPKEKAVAKVKEGRDKIATEAAGKARGVVGDGLLKGSDAIGSVAKLVNDTAPGLDDNLGTEYGDYARKAATYLDDTAQKLAAKDPDELIDDTREFVRKSPGIALAGAAIIGFALARLVSSGLDAEKNR
ncbi:hypothetical protein [Sphingomicrobium flavum]|uniref:hypothetical protein n=1 Tax=Sphingomicrobium flavum TaxID=1229164 RepID=UPI0021AD648B|nr:hypothetical protein [Sphingomicrobium flavum]